MTMTYEEARKYLPPIWTIYENPREYPGKFVVRVWWGEYADTEREAKILDTLTEAREWCVLDGAGAQLARHADDDPCIVESWI